MKDENVFNSIGTTTSRQAEEGVNYWCTICKKNGHVARHHKMFPDIYDKEVEDEIKT